MATAIKRMYDNVRAGQAVIRDANRLGQILAVLARHGFGHVVQGLNLQDRWLISKALEAKVADLERVPLERRIVRAIHELGPTFVKLGQMLSTRPDLLPPALVEELQTLQDAVPPLSFEEVREVVGEELGADVDEVFDDFDPQPLASASIAQVHRARLKDRDGDVVVKVQRPGIAPQLEADLEIMGYLARALETNFPEARLFSPAASVAEFERAILREIDFRIELDHLERFARNFATQPRVHFPVPVREYSTARVLTMEFIDGIKITALSPERTDGESLIRTGIETVLQMVYVDGFFHGDLHPGNLLVRADGTLCFLDCGLCGQLTPRRREQMVDLLIAVVREDFESVARLFWRIGIHGPESTQDYDVFAADIVECMERWFAGKTVAGLEFGGFFKHLVELALKHRIRLPADYTMTFKAVITMEGVAKQLAPDMDVVAMAQPIVLRLMTERYDPRRLLERGHEVVRELAEVLGSLPETSRGVLEDLRAGRTRVNVDWTRAPELQRTYARVQARNMVAVLAAASALCGTLALDYRDQIIFGIPAVSFAFYGASAAFAGWFALSGRHI